MPGLSKQKQNILRTAAAVLVLLILWGLMLLLSVNYQEAYGYPRTKDANIDFEAYNYSDSYVGGFVMQGEWEFFYNKWIITDGLNDAPDAMITLPGLWTGLEVDGKRLPKSGYASYRATISNLKAGDEINVVTYNSPGAYRVYINGKLNTVSGRLSKNASETFSSGRVNEEYPHTVTEGEILTVVVEMSAAVDGGMFDPPVILPVRTHMYSLLYNSLTQIVAGIIAAYVVFIFILYFGIYRKQKRFSLPALLLSVLLHYFTSKEVYYRFSMFTPFINYAIIRHISFLSGILIIAVFVYHLLRQKTIEMPKAGIYALTVSNIGFVALYYLLRGTAFQMLPVLLSFLSVVYVIHLLSRAIGGKVKFARINLAMLLFLTDLIIAECMDNLGWVMFTMETPTSVILLLFVVCVSVLSFITIRDNAKAALDAVVLARENEQIKHQALRSQIKPHFIFNVLSSVQTLYKNDPAMGDEALAKFASHLRQNIDADNHDLIPFEDELKNIENYTELENLRSDKRVTLFLDIDYFDFEVPILSLQPLVENAIKYADTQMKENGFIRITSKLQDGFITLEVADNGKGFDVSGIRQDAAGLKNCAERFKYLLNADLTILSAPGEGTTVTVRIPDTTGSFLRWSK